MKKGINGIVLVLIITLLCSLPLAHAGQIFYNSLDSQEAVEAGGGTFHGGSFEPAKVGNGFLSAAQGESVSFPTEGNGQINLINSIMFFSFSK